MASFPWPPRRTCRRPHPSWCATAQQYLTVNGTVKQSHTFSLCLDTTPASLRWSSNNTGHEQRFINGTTRFDRTAAHRVATRAWPSFSGRQRAACHGALWRWTPTPPSIGRSITSTASRTSTCGRTSGLDRRRRSTSRRSSWSGASKIPARRPPKSSSARPASSTPFRRHHPV